MVVVELTESELNSMYGQIMKDMEYFDDDCEYSINMRNIAEKLRQLGAVDE